MSSFEIESDTVAESLRSESIDSALDSIAPTFSLTSTVVTAPTCCITVEASVFSPAFTSTSAIVVSMWLEPE